MTGENVPESGGSKTSVAMDMLRDLAEDVKKPKK